MGSTSMHYESYYFGEPWLTDRKPLLLQHGFGRSSKFWYEWIPTLAVVRPTFVPDLPGMGKSAPSQTTKNFEGMVESLVRLLDQLDVESVHYCGESIGGILGTMLAAEHPARVTSLTLVSTPTRLTERGRAAVSFGYEDQVAAVSELGGAKWSELYNESRFGATGTADLKKWYAQEMGRSDHATLVSMAGELAKADLGPYLQRVNCPSLVISASGSPVADDSERNRLVELLRPSREIVLNSAGHNVVNVLAQRCTEELLRFVDDVDHHGLKP